MHQTKSLFICFLSCFVLTTNANIESIIKPCKADDKSCLTSSTQEAVPPVAAGIPELGVPTFDPIDIDLMKCDEKGLKFTFENTHIVGPGKTKVLEVERDTDKKTIKLVIELPLTITGKYDMQGKILILPVVGNGDFSLITDNIKFNIIMRYKITERDGNQYWKVTGFDYTFDLVEKCYLKFENLFNGDPVAAKPVNELLDASWKEVVTEFGGCIMEKAISVYVNNINKLFQSVPTNKLEIL